MWNKLLPDGNPNDQSRHGGMTNEQNAEHPGGTRLRNAEYLMGIRSVHLDSEIRIPHSAFRIGIWSLVIGHLFISGPAWAHGDDDVTAVSFLGPLVLVAVLAAGLSIGRPVIRWLARRE